MKDKIARFISDRLIRYPGFIALVIIIVVGLSVWKMTQLTINYNQLELIPQDLPSVVATKKMFNLAGGYGNLYLALRGDDLDHMKKVANDLTARINDLPQVRDASCKQKHIDFMKKHVAYFMDLEDLEKIYDLFRKKIRSATREKMGLKSDSSDIDKQIEEIVGRYGNINLQHVDDKYNLDPKGEMILIVVDADGIPNNLDFSRKLLDDVNSIIEEYNRENPNNAVLKQKYGGEMAEGSTITYGITGEFKLAYQDSMHLKKALAPVSTVAFIGILFYLSLLLRRPSQIILIMLILVMSIFITFGFTKVALGELNVVTAMLGAILMGFGIDFGIHYIFRFREEYSHRLDLHESIHETIRHSGYSSFISAMTVAVSLFVLVLADFKGFSHLGLIAGVGILIIATMMYIFLPVMYMLFDRIWPGFKNNLIINISKIDRADLVKIPFPHARKILIVSLILTLGLAWFTTRIQFDYDSRSFATGDTPALVLMDEIQERFGRKGLPSIIYTDNLEDTEAVYRKLKEHPDKYDRVEQVYSIFTIAPPMEKQMKVRAILDKMQMRIEMLPEDIFEGENKKIFDLVQNSVTTQPYTMEEVPDDLLEQFRPVPESGEDGYFTLIIPRGSNTNSKNTMKFTKQAGSITVNNNTYHATGHMILMANLAMIVLRDGKIFPALTAALILLIIMIHYRDPRALVFAMLPLLGGMIWMLGLMSLFDWKINYINIVVFPVVLGYGISNGIHLYNRYLESRSVMVAIRHTGAAVAGSSITTLIGWGALFFSGHRGITSMGALAVFGISAALLVAFTVMPALLQFAEDKKILIPKDIDV